MIDRRTLLSPMFESLSNIQCCNGQIPTLKKYVEGEWFILHFYLCLSAAAISPRTY